MKRLSTAVNDHSLLFTLLFVAAAIRFFDPLHLPFMHDELSALIRAQAGNMAELIQKAETTDVHPVGIHVFLHFWSGWFGQHELLVKLPFLLMGIAAIYFSYRIAERWFNPTTAIFTAAFMATLQFTTMYGQLARPYASGIFFCTWMVWFWSRFLLDGRKALGGFILAATLCCYNHYFSMLFAGIVGLTGLFFLTKRNAAKYLMACAAIVILFFPHVSVSLTQFTAGQEQSDWWIAKPDPGWPFLFLKYLFHYSKVIYTLVFVLLFLGFTFYRSDSSLLHKMRLVCIAWAILPFTVIFLYSIKNTPILQFSSMTFSLPFLLMAFFSFFRDIGIWEKTISIAAIVLLNTVTLFAERKHHHVFYKQPYEQMALMSLDMAKAHPEKRVSSAHLVMDGFMDHYFLKYGPFDFLRVDKPDIKQFSTYVAAQTSDYFVAGNLPGEYLFVIRKKYPYRIKSVESFTCWVHCFSKKPADFAASLPEPKNEIIAKLSTGEGNWDDLPRKDSLLVIPNEQEFGAGAEIPLKETWAGRYCDVQVLALISCPEEGSNPLIVCTVHDGEKQLVYAAAEYDWYRRPGEKAAQVWLSVPLRDTDPAKQKGLKLKVYVWNRDRKEVQVEDLIVGIQESNRYVYGLYEPF